MVFRKDLDLEFDTQREKRPAATFGPPRGISKPNPCDFQKSHFAMTTTSMSRAAQPNAVAKQKRKPKLDVSCPAAHTTSQRNFLKENAARVIQNNPPPQERATMRYVEKADYGQVPSYLKEVKMKMHEDAQRQAAAESLRKAQEKDAQMIQLQEHERQELLCKLKIQWGILNAAFQRLPLQLDTPSKKRRKERLEEQLAQTEADINLLQLRPKVMVLLS